MVVKTAKAQELFSVLPDTGAQLSLINYNLVTRLRLHMFKPTGLKYIQLANKSVVRRKGFVELPITVLFPDSDLKPQVLMH